MPRFLGDRDIEFFKQINRELLNDVIETPVILYKLNIKTSPTNVYGEAPKKVYHVGVQVSCLVNRQDAVPTSDGYVLDFTQASTFSFLRETLQEKSIYPQVGDLVEYDSSFYEVNNVTENQLLGDQPFNNWSIICTGHLTKKSVLQLTPRNPIPNELE